MSTAFGTVTGAIASVGSGVWAVAGLLSPEAMTLSFAGLVASVGLPAPWGAISSSGIVVHAHGTQTGQDTTSYSVNFSGVVPSSGSITAYLAATITTIQQNSFPITGPPPGHPSYNPNFIPTIGYAQTVYSVALSAVTGGVDNVNTFELARVTLTPGQSAIVSGSTVGWYRATDYKALPPASLVSGGLLTTAQAQQLLLPATTGLTHTLPLTAGGGGLIYELANSTAGSWTIAASGLDTIAGLASAAGVTSFVIPPSGAARLWGNAVSGVWDVLSVNPALMTSLPNIWSSPNSFAGAVTVSGVLATVSNASVGGSLGVAGSGAIAGQLNLASGLAVTGPLAVSGTASFYAGVVDAGFDAGGLNIRFAATGYGAGWRNDNVNIYLLLTASGSALGAFNSLRPFTVALANGAVTIDATGAGTTFGGAITTAGQVTAGGYHSAAGGVTVGGPISTSSTITAAGLITAGAAGFSSPAGPINVGGGITSQATITGNALRAAIGARNSGDPNRGIILNDFSRFTSGAGSIPDYIVEILPDGTIIQMVSGISPTGADFITFPVAFPNGCYNVVAGEGNPIGWNSGANPSAFGCQQVTATNFALYVSVWNGSSWALHAGVAYRYVAMGN